MYNPQKVIGDFFEERLMQLFDLARSDPEMSGSTPDLAARDGSFFIEVKASAYNNGGVINKSQMRGFDKRTGVRRFYAFAYHSVAGCMQEEYPTADELMGSLDIRSLYIFPFSVVKAHYECSKPRTHPRHDDFVQLRESQARRIFSRDPGTWAKLRLNADEYRTTEPHERVHIMTRAGYLENELLDSFHPELI
jgi:hypothetical protein